MTILGDLKIAALTLSGRNPLCSFSQTRREYRRALAQNSAQARILKSLKMIGKDESGLQQWQTSRGTFWAPPNTNADGLALILAEAELRAYEKDNVELKPSDIVLDCGANIGVFSHHALAAGCQRVVAIEPFGPNIECLQRNLAEGIASGRATIVQKGLWDSSGSLPFIVDSNNAGGNSLITRNAGAVDGGTIAVTTIDELVKELSLPRVDFIKMDIEASERRALRGGAGTLAKFGPKLAIAVEHTPDRRENANAVVAAVNGSGTPYQIGCGFCYISAQGCILPEVLYFSASFTAV